MKLFKLLIITALIYSTLSLAQEWQDIEGPEGTPISRVFQSPTNQTELFAFANSRQVYHSTNLGENWEIWNLNWGLEHYIYNIVMNPVHDQNFLAKTNAGFFFTEDAGQNWEVFHHNLPSSPKNIIFDSINGNNLYAYTSDTIFVSNDMGKTWTSHLIEIDNSQYITDLAISPLNPNLWVITISGHYSTKIFTSDQGASLQIPPALDSLYYSKVFFSQVDPQRIFTQYRNNSDEYHTLVSHDSGHNWQTMPGLGTSSLASMVDSGDRIFYAYNSNGTDQLFFSDDFGQSEHAFVQAEHIGTFKNLTLLSGEENSWLSYGASGFYHADDLAGPWQRRVNHLGFAPFTKVYRNPFSSKVAITTHSEIWFTPDLNLPLYKIGLTALVDGVDSLAFNESMILISTREGIKRHLGGEQWELISDKQGELAVLPGYSDMLFVVNESGIEFSYDLGAQWQSYEFPFQGYYSLAVQPDTNTLFISSLTDVGFATHAFNWEQLTMATITTPTIYPETPETSFHYPTRLYTTQYNGDFSGGYTDNIGQSWDTYLAVGFESYISKINTSIIHPDILYAELKDTWIPDPSPSSRISYDHGLNWHRIDGPSEQKFLIGDNLLTQKPFGGLMVWRNISGNAFNIPSLSFTALVILILLVLISTFYLNQRKFFGSH